MTISKHRDVPRMIGLFGAACIAMAATTRAPAGLEGQLGLSTAIEDRAVVRLLPDIDLGAFILAFQANNDGVELCLLDEIDFNQTCLLDVDLPEGMTYNELATDLSEDYAEFLVWGEFLYKNASPEGHTGSLFVDGIDDSFFHEQYAVDLLNLQAAHNLSTAEGRVVAVLDTGADHTHPFLEGHMLGDSLNLVTGGSNTLDVGDGVDTDGDGAIDEMVGHGTFVSGLIVLAAPDVRILPIRVLNGDGEGNAWKLAKGIHFAVERGVDVINLSLGSTFNAQVVNDAIERARDAGILTVSAAGNLNRSDPAEYPAMLSIGFGIAATDPTDLKAAFSNFHDQLSMSAPGASIFISEDPLVPDLTQSIISTVPGGGYAVSGGTSMSGAFVSAAAALIRAQYPMWQSNLQTYNAMRFLLQTSTVDINENNPGFIDRLGAGRLDVYAALNAGPSPADLNGDGSVDVDDLIIVLLAWGPCPPWPDACIADLSDNDSVDVDDLIAVLLEWGS